MFSFKLQNQPVMYRYLPLPNWKNQQKQQLMNSVLNKRLF